jgi:hypothetical protein
VAAARGRLRLDLDRYQAFLGDAPVALTVTEFTLLQALIVHPGHVKTRAQLIAEAYPNDAYVSDRTIDSHVKRLRRKLAEIDPAYSRDGLRSRLPFGRRRVRLEVRSWRPLSRLWGRLLAFNVLLVFLPVAGFLYLDVYERELLTAQERAMVQQGRLAAAALGGGAMGPGDAAIDPAAASSSSRRPSRPGKRTATTGTATRS